METIIIQKIYNFFKFKYLFISVLKRIIKIISVWHWRYTQRRQLANLSDNMLKDIGVSRVDAIKVSSRPFWKA